MKKFKIFVTAFLLLLIVHCSLKIEDCLSQWTQQNLPYSAAIDDIAFLNKESVLKIFKNITQYISDYELFDQLTLL